MDAQLSSSWLNTELHIGPDGENLPRNQAMTRNRVDLSTMPVQLDSKNHLVIPA